MYAESHRNPQRLFILIYLSISAAYLATPNASQSPLRNKWPKHKNRYVGGAATACQIELAQSISAILFTVVAKLYLSFST